MRHSNQTVFGRLFLESDMICKWQNTDRETLLPLLIKTNKRFAQQTPLQVDGWALKPVPELFLRRSITNFRHSQGIGDMTM